MRSKQIYPGGWVRVRPLMNTQFRVDDPACRLCRRASCATAWVHVSARVVVCARCLRDPWGDGVALAERLGVPAHSPYGLPRAGTDRR